MGSLPEISGLPVALDTETSGLYVDDGSRIAVVSWAYREPKPGPDGRLVYDHEGKIQYKAVAFDQGVADLPLGDKQLNDKTLKRIHKTKPIEIKHRGEVIEVVPREWFERPAPNLDPRWWDVLMEWFSRQRIIYHNAKFDMQQVRAGLRGRAGAPTAERARALRSPIVGSGYDLESAFWWDTQLTQAVLEPQHGTSLKPTAERLELGQSVGIAGGHEADEQRALAPWLGPKTGKDADPRFDLVPWEIMEPYAAGDALLTLLLQEHQGARMESTDGHWWPHVDRQFDLMIALYRMENRGIGFDAKGALGECSRLDEARGRVAQDLPFVPTPAKARAYFFNDPSDDPPGCGVIPRSDKVTKPSRTFPQGQAQVDDEVITTLTQHANPAVSNVAKVYQQWAGISSAISKWYGAWPHMVGPDGRLRTNYRQARVVSGRLSAERAQLQAIPQPYQIDDIKDLVEGSPLRHIREFFVAKPGYRHWEMDVANAEPRIATMIARCQPMYDAVVLRGEDTHGAATRLMFATQFGEEFGPEHPDWNEYRQVGKRCNLGILYAAGPGTIQAQIRKFTGVDYPVSQVAVWVDMYRRAFREFVQATEWWARFADKTGYVRLVNGRLRYFQAYEPIHKAFNQVIQGSVAETITDGMINVEALIEDAMLLQVHDSLVLEVPEGEEGVAQFAEAAATLRLTFERAFRLRWRKDEARRFMPFPVDCKPFGRTKLACTPDDQAEMEEAIQAAYDRMRPAWTILPSERIAA